MRKIIKIVLLVIIGALFLWTIYFLIQKSRKVADVFEIKTLFKTNIVKKTMATGSVIPRREIAVKPQISGIISEINVEAGDFVKQGDIIAKVRIIPNMENLNNAESSVNKAKINLNDAKIEYDRQKELFDKQVISKSEFQKYLTAYNRANEGMEFAENNLQLIKEGVTKNLAKTSNTLIRSTISGTVLDVPIKEGNNVIQTNTFNDGTTIAVIADMTDIIFQGKIDETDVGKIKTGMNLEINIGAIQNEKFNAILTYISPQGKDENGSVQFEIKADVKLSEKQTIRAGYSANADIILERRDSILAIDESLIHFKNDSTFVNILTKEKPKQEFKEKYIKTGLSDGINIEVVDGVTIKDKLKGNKIDISKKKGEKKDTKR